MLYLKRAPDIRPLVHALSDLLSQPLLDPMAHEWIAVPSMGMQRWTRLELSRRLGSSPGREDGVTANIEFKFPGTLRQLLFDSAYAEYGEFAHDPWHIEQMVWSVLEILEENEREQLFAGMPELPPGASPYDRARRVADLFDRYALHRPELINLWRTGQNVDASAHRLARDLGWQPELWRILQTRIGEPSPPERLGSLLDRVRRGDLMLDLPPRISIFGLTSLPGGDGFLDLIEAIAAVHDVHCFFLDLSPAASQRIRQEVRRADNELLRTRARVRTQDRLHHPLLISWGAPFREREVMLALAGLQGRFPSISDREKTNGFESSSPSLTLLAEIQREIKFDLVPDGAYELALDDRSIVLHGCYGRARQVEVLRDAILHLLEDDPDLREEEIVVLCPMISEFSPYIEAGFGLPTKALSGFEGGALDVRSVSGSTFRYYMSDHSLRGPNELFDAFDCLLELVGGRCSASGMLEFISLDPVRRRFDFDDDALSKINRWTKAANVKWGLSASHRQALGFPGHLELNSWRSAVESLLFGVTIHDLEFELAEGGVVPIGLEGEDIGIAGQLGELIDRLEDLAERYRKRRSPREWCEVLADAAESFFDVDRAASWQFSGLRQALARISESAIGQGEAEGRTLELSLTDMRRVISEELRGTPGRSDFFRGGVTVTSLTPLRWIPFKVVCLLGLDDGLGGEAVGIGDDVMALTPKLGDPDPRSETHQSILEAVLAAQERVIVTFTAADAQTNLPTPRSVELLELEDAITQALTPTSRLDYRRSCIVDHPRQSYDDRNFEAGQLGHDGPWSFNRAALSGALARRKQDSRPRPLVENPLPSPEGEGTFTLEELREFLRHPARFFLRNSLQIFRPYEDRETSDELPLVLDPLERADIGRRLLSTRLGLSTGDAWEGLREPWWAREQARGALPIGDFARRFREEIEKEVAAFIVTLRDMGVDPAQQGSLVEIGDLAVQQAGHPPRFVSGRLEVGEFEGPGDMHWHGAWDARFSRLRPADELCAWLDLIVLTLHEPETVWRRLSLRRPTLARNHLGIVNISLAGDSNEARRENAYVGLDLVLRLAALGRREPLPLFANLSKSLHSGTVGGKDWVSGRIEAFSDGADPDNVLAFGALKLDDLLEIPARASDPGKGSSRAIRLAGVLWGTYSQTVVEEAAPIPDLESTTFLATNG